MYFVVLAYFSPNNLDHLLDKDIATYCHTSLGDWKHQESGTKSHGFQKPRKKV